MPEVSYRVTIGDEVAEVLAPVEYDRDPVMADTVPTFKLKIPNVHGYHARRYYAGKQVKIYKLNGGNDESGVLKYNGRIEMVRVEKTGTRQEVELSGPHYWFDILRTNKCYHYRTYNGTFAPAINTWLFGRYAPSQTQADEEELADGLRPDEIIRAIIGTKFFYQEFFTNSDAFDTNLAVTFNTVVKKKTDGSDDGYLELAPDGLNWKTTGEIQSVVLQNNPEQLSKMGKLLDAKARIKAKLPGAQSIEQSVKIAWSADGGNSFPSGWVNFAPIAGTTDQFESTLYTFTGNLTAPSTRDVSLNRITLTTVGFPASVASGLPRYGNGIRLDGVDDYLYTVNSGTLYNLTDSASVFLNLTVRTLPSAGKKAWILASQDSDDPATISFGLNVDDQGRLTYTHTRRDGTNYSVTTAAAITAGTNATVTLRRRFKDNANGEVIIKVNGVEYTSHATATLSSADRIKATKTVNGQTVNISRTFTIGKYLNDAGTGSNELLKADLFELRIWGWALPITGDEDSVPTTVVGLAPLNLLDVLHEDGDLSWRDRRVGDEAACYFFDAVALENNNQLVYKLQLNSVGGAGTPQIDYLRLEASTVSDTGLYEGEIDQYDARGGGSDIVSINLIGKNRLQALEEVRRLTISRESVNPSPHWDLRISVDGRIDFKEVIGSDILLPDSPTGRLGSENSATVVLKREVDANIGNVLRGVGAGTEPFAMTVSGSGYEDADSIGIYGRRPMVYLDSSITDLVTLSNKTTAALKYYKSEREIIEIEGRDYFSALDPGDFIYLDRDFVDTSERFRVMDLTILYDPSTGRERFRATLANKGTSGVANIVNALTNAAEDQKNIQQVGRVGNTAAGVAVRFGKDQDGNWEAGKHMITIDDEDATRVSVYIRTEPFNAYAKAAATTLTDHAHGMAHVHGIPALTVNAVTTDTRVRTSLDKFQAETGNAISHIENLTKLDAGFQLDRPEQVLGQVFQATKTERLAAIQLHLRRSMGSLNPGDLKLALYPNAQSLGDSVMTAFGSDVEGNIAGAKDDVVIGHGDTSVNAINGSYNIRNNTTGTSRVLGVSWDLGFGGEIPPDGFTLSWRTYGAMSSTRTIKIENSSNGTNWTVYKSYSITPTADSRNANNSIRYDHSFWFEGTPTVRHWRISITGPSGTSTGHIIYEAGMWRKAAFDATKRNMPASIGGAYGAGIDRFRTEGSLREIPPETIATSPSWSAESEWTFPHVILTQNDWYWFTLSGAGTNHPSNFDEAKWWNVSATDTTQTNLYAFRSNANGLGWERIAPTNGRGPFIHFKLDDSDNDGVSTNTDIRVRDSAGFDGDYSNNSSITDYVSPGPYGTNSRGYGNKAVGLNHTNEPSVATLFEAPATHTCQNDSFSVSFWINRTAAPSTEYVILSGSSAPYPEIAALADGRIRVRGYQSSTVQTAAAYGTLGTGAWRHVAATFDSALQELKMYVDGVLTETVTVSNAFANGWRAKATLRTNNHLGDFRIYDYVLTADAVSALHRMSLARNPCLAFRLRFGDLDAEVKKITSTEVWTRFATKFVADQAHNEVSIYFEIRNEQDTAIPISVRWTKVRGNTSLYNNVVNAQTVGALSTYKYFAYTTSDIQAGDQIHAEMKVDSGGTVPSSWALLNARTSATTNHAHDVTGATTVSSTSEASSTSTTANGGGSHSHELQYGIYKFKGDTPGVNPVYPTKLRVYIGQENYENSIAATEFGEFGFSDRAFDSGIIDISNTRKPDGTFLFRRTGPNGSPGRFKPGMYPLYIEPVDGDTNNVNGLGRAHVAHITERVNVGA